MLPPTEILEGYENPELIEMMFRKARDFSPTHRWEEFANRSTVLDFGGGFAQHYKCATPLSPDVRWAVVETPAVVARASVLASDKLRFFTSVAAAADWLGEIDLMHSDGALHYSPDPLAGASRPVCGGGKGNALEAYLPVTRPIAPRSRISFRGSTKTVRGSQASAG